MRVINIGFYFAAALLCGCAGGRQIAITPVEIMAFDADSARTLIRRGLTDEARAVISPEGSLPTDSLGLALWANSLERDGDYHTASLAWLRLVARHPDTFDLRSRYWKALLKLGEADRSLADSVGTIILQEGDEFALRDDYAGMALAWQAASLLSDSIAEPRADRLIAAFPDSQLAVDVVGGRFWDGLYPIWNDNEPRIAYLRDFIAKYRLLSWRDPAWRMMVGIYAGMGDSAAMQLEASAWAASAPEDPSVLYSAATFLFEHGGDADSARVWAEAAYRLRDRLTRPPHNPPEEWLLYGPQIRAGIPTLLARIRLRDGDLDAALKLATEGLQLADYGVDEYATPAPQHYVLGQIYQAQKAMDAAADHYIEALIHGDVRNEYASSADSALRRMFGFETDEALLKFCRERKGYKGIVFKRVTDKIGLAGAKGSRVAWGDYDNDGDDDLLCNGRMLFRNDVVGEPPLTPPLLRGGGSDENSPPVSGDDANFSPPVSGGELKGGQRYFTDVTEEVGLGAEGVHGGIWGDYDNDGDLDLFCFSSSGDTSKGERLYRNSLKEKPPLTPPLLRRGGSAPNSPPVPGGAQDLSPPVPGGELKGGSLFEDVTAKSGAIRDTFSTEAAIWGDFNTDGRLDLYVAGYEKPYNSVDELGSGWPDRLLIQDASGAFQDSTAAYGMIPPGGKNLCGRSPVTCDFDRDGDLDLYIGNYRLQENQFYVNLGNPPLIPPYFAGGEVGATAQFINRAAWYMVDGEEVDGWFGHTIGCQWGDFDGDGDFDLIACNLAHPRYIGFSNRTMLYRNDGFLKPFVEVRRDWGIKYDECHSEPCWGDFDNDGDLDLYITCVYPDRRSYLYRNDGDRFTDITFLSGTRVFNGWGCATADYNNDGRLDLAVCAGGQVELFRNGTDGGNWVEVELDTLDFIGLSKGGFVFELKTYPEEGTGYQKQIRQFEWGKGAGSQSSLTIHFGLGNVKNNDLVSLDVVYSRSLHGSGMRRRFHQPFVNQKVQTSMMYLEIWR